MEHEGEEKIEKIKGERGGWIKKSLKTADQQEGGYEKQQTTGGDCCTRQNNRIRERREKGTRRKIYRRIT